LSRALSQCFVSEADPANNRGLYRAVVQATTTHWLPSIRNVNLSRTVRTAINLTIAVPTRISVNLTNNMLAYDAPVRFADLKQQIFNASNRQTLLQLYTSLQYPYQLVPLFVNASSNYSLSPQPQQEINTPSCQLVNGICEQRFVTHLIPVSADICLFETPVDFTFSVQYSSPFTGACSPNPPFSHPQVSFNLTSNNFCPQIIDVNTLTGSLSVYKDSNANNQTNEFVPNTTAYFVASVSSSSGPAIASVDVVSVLVSSNGYTVELNQTLPLAQFTVDNGYGTASQTLFSFVLSPQVIYFNADPDIPTVCVFVCFSLCFGLCF